MRKSNKSVPERKPGFFVKSIGCADDGKRRFSFSHKLISLRTPPIIIDEFADGGNNVNIVEGLVSEALGKKPGFFGVRQFLVHYIYVFTLHLAQTAFGIDAGCPEVLLGYPNADP